MGLPRLGRIYPAEGLARHLDRRQMQVSFLATNHRRGSRGCRNSGNLTTAVRREQTSSSPSVFLLQPLGCLSKTWDEYEAAGVHKALWRHGDDVAGHCARATDADDWIAGNRDSSGMGRTDCGVPSRSGRSWLHRRKKRRGRISMGRRAIRAAGLNGKRPGPTFRAVLVAFTTPAALAAKAATTTTPIVFAMISDPVQTGLVTSLSRPDGNITGTTYLNLELGP